MNEETTGDRLIEWLTFLPVWIAYRLIWLAARTGNSDARAVYRAMWDANLDLPALVLKEPRACEQTADTPGAGLIPEEDGLRELGLLYNYAEDDSRQFTRWQMLEAMNHGFGLASEKAALKEPRA
jgi:hypothetical protein